MRIRTKLLLSLATCAGALGFVLMSARGTFSDLRDGFSRINASAELGVADSQAVATKTTEATQTLAATAERLPLLSEGVEQTRMRVQILERKILGVSESLDELNETIAETCELLPEGDARDELEWLADDLGDLQETVKREALVGLSEATESMQASSEQLDVELQTVLDVAAQLESSLALTGRAVQGSVRVTEIADDFDEVLTEESQALTMTVACILIAIPLAILGFIRFLTRSLRVANGIADGITDGNLEQDIRTNRKDEVGDLLRAMDAMQTGMRESLESIQLARQADHQKTSELETAQEQQRQQADELERSSAAIQKAAQEQAAAAEHEAMRTAELEAKVDEILEAVERVAAGDLTANLEAEGEDAIDRVGASIAELVTRLQQSFSSIAESAGSLGASSETLAGISQDLDQQVDQSSSEADQVAGTARELSAHIQTVAAATEEMTASIQEISSQTGNGARVAHQAVAQAEEAAGSMARLASSADEIQSFIGVISGIAEQTNLLALNATIEAARAGESGKGFAVVANEVKELAGATAHATEEISKRIASVRVSTEDSVKVIEAIGGVIGEISEIQNAIASAVEEQTATTNEIARTVGDAASGGNRIAESVSSLATSTHETREGASRSRHSADDLSGYAHDLNALVSQFRY